MIIIATIIIGLVLAAGMLIKPSRYPIIAKYGEAAEIGGHGAVGVFCYLVITRDWVELLLIFVLIEAVQYLFCKRGFGYNDIFYSMLAVAIIQTISKI